jgi:hypothetical protein
MHSSHIALLVLSLASGGRSYIPHDHPQHRIATGLCFVPRGAVRGRSHTKQHAGVPLCRNDLSQVHMQEASGGSPGGGIPGFRYVTLPTSSRGHEPSASSAGLGTHKTHAGTVHAHCQSLRCVLPIR